ncbi:MAG: hypothetical protein E7647_00335 [Ruminococcaceae bacterium]|nr:hypothetical protein [Oscillospiraceae bacterium]
MYGFMKYHSSYRTKDGVAVRERNKVYTHKDCLVYRRSALKNAKKREKAEKKTAPKSQKTKPENKWE